MILHRLCALIMTFFLSTLSGTHLTKFFTLKNCTTLSFTSSGTDLPCILLGIASIPCSSFSFLALQTMYSETLTCAIVFLIDQLCDKRVRICMFSWRFATWNFSFIASMSLLKSWQFVHCWLELGTNRFWQSIFPIAAICSAIISCA